MRAYASRTTGPRPEIAAVSERLVPTAGVSLLDVDDAVAELQRCAGMGFRAVCLPIDPPDGHDQFNRDSWEPLWAAAEEAEVASCSTSAPATPRTSRRTAGRAARC